MKAKASSVQLTSRNPSNPKDCVKTQETKIIITYLIRVFDTTRESKFWALKFLFHGQFLFFHVDMKANKAFDPVKKYHIDIMKVV